MMNFNVTNEKNLAELLKTLLSNHKYKLVLTKDDEPVASVTFEEKPNVKEMTDAEKIQEWARLEKIKKDDEIVVTKNGNPAIIKESELDDLIKTQKSRKSGFGILKDKYKFPADFDEKFVAMDAEILADFSDDSDCELMEAAK